MEETSNATSTEESRLLFILKLGRILILLAASQFAVPAGSVDRSVRVQKQAPSARRGRGLPFKPVSFSTCLHLLWGWDFRWHAAGLCNSLFISRPSTVFTSGSTLHSRLFMLPYSRHKSCPLPSNYLYFILNLHVTRYMSKLLHQRKWLGSEQNRNERFRNLNCKKHIDIRIK